MRSSPFTAERVSEKPVPGRLYLVPTPLDFGCDEKAMAPIAHLLPEATIAVAATLPQWITENAKSTRAFFGPHQSAHTASNSHSIDGYTGNTPRRP